MLNWLNVLKNMPDMDEDDYERQPAFFQELLDECRISKLTAMEKGREALLQTAKNLLSKGMSAEDVSEVTGLNIDCVRELLSR